MKLNDISVILMVLGIAIILTSFLNFYNLLFPVLIKNPEWVFLVSQKIAGIIILPILGITFFLLGLNISKFKRNQKIVNIAKFSLGILNLSIFLFLSLNIVLYGISMNAVKNKNIQTLKTEVNTLKENINVAYNSNIETNATKKYNLEIKQLDDDLIYQINYLNFAYTKMNIKTLMTLFIFFFVYLIATIKLFSLDRLLPKKNLSKT